MTVFDQIIKALIKRVDPTGLVISQKLHTFNYMERYAHEYAHILALKKHTLREEYIHLLVDHDLSDFVKDKLKEFRHHTMESNEIRTVAIEHLAFDGWFENYDKDWLIEIGCNGVNNNRYTRQYMTIQQYTVLFDIEVRKPRNKRLALELRDILLQEH